MSPLDTYILVWLALISLTATIATIKDKHAAKVHSFRVPERTLLLFGLAGGALAEYLTMLAIRHKTKHKKFMIILPLEIVLHIALATIYILN